MGNKLCKSCRFFDSSGGPNDRPWCFRNDIYVGLKYPQCDKFVQFPHESRQDPNTVTFYENPSYEGFREREKDRIKEKKLFFYYSVGAGVIAVVIGVVLGYLLRYL